MTYLKILFLFSILLLPFPSSIHLTCAVPETLLSLFIVIFSLIPYNPCLLDEEIDCSDRWWKGFPRSHMWPPSADKRWPECHGSSQNSLDMLKTCVTPPHCLRLCNFDKVLPSLSFCSFISRLEVFIPGRTGAHCCLRTSVCSRLTTGFLSSFRSALGWLSCDTP